jgi:ferredoxin/flavodoxin---NADP+ reductase
MTPAEIAELRARRYNATVVYLHKPNSDLMVMRVKPDFPRPPHHGSRAARSSRSSPRR